MILKSVSTLPSRTQAAMQPWIHTDPHPAQELTRRLRGSRLLTEEARAQSVPAAMWSSSRYGIYGGPSLRVNASVSRGRPRTRSCPSVLGQPSALQTKMRPLPLSSCNSLTTSSKLSRPDSITGLSTRLSVSLPSYLSASKSGRFGLAGLQFTRRPSKSTSQLKSVSENPFC